jgi:cytochrome c-type biogenesis protein CcmH/NrfF
MVFRSPLSRRFVLACAMTLVGFPVLAGTPDQDAAALTRQLMSPFCPGLLLADCQSSGASELRAEIRARVDAGESKNAIIDDLVLRFGAAVRGQPEPHGFGVVAWGFPVLLAAVTFVPLVRRLRAATVHVRETEPGLPPSDGDRLTAARIDDELSAMD